jgi:hypothetical protein
MAAATLFVTHRGVIKFVNVVYDGKVRVDLVVVCKLMRALVGLDLSVYAIKLDFFLKKVLYDKADGFLTQERK